jgi:hypothetical protein
MPSKNEPVEVKFKGDYPGIPRVVTPEVAETLKAEHPNYEEFAPVVEERLAVYNYATKLAEPAIKEHQEAERARAKAAAKAEPASEDVDADVATLTLDAPDPVEAESKKLAGLMPVVEPAPQEGEASAAPSTKAAKGGK